MFTSKEYRKIARDKLKGNWGRAVLISFLAALLGGSSGSGSSSVSSSASSATEAASGAGVEGALGSVGEAISGNPLLSGVIASAGLLLAVVGIALLLVGGAVRLGHCRYYTELVLNNKSNSVGILFSRFDIFLKAAWLNILIAFKVLLWTLLFIIPGIIAAYRYALAPYILAENPNMKASEAINESKRLMQGHKGRLFGLQISFIGWAILSACTLGIGNLWLVPYTEAATAAFYIDRTGRNIPLPGNPIV